MKILVATDFSPEATEAARVATELARVAGASVHFIHVHEADSIYPLDAGAMDEAEAARHLAAQSIELGADPTAITVRSGDILTVLADEVAARAPDLVVVGACGARGKSSFRDHAETLALTLPCPVLVVRPVDDRMRFALANKRPLRVFVAADRSEASDGAISWVRGLRRTLPCDVIVVHYYDPSVEHRRLGVPPGEVPFTGHPRVVAALTEELHQRMGNLGGNGALTVHCEPRVGLTAVDLLGSARVANADLIVVGAHRRSKVSRFVYGSVARDILRHSDIPVVCVSVPTAAA